MSVNFRGDSLSDAQIQSFALQLRHFHGLGEMDIPDLEKKSVLTRFGEKQFEYRIVPDVELGGDEAITLVSEKHVRILIARSTYDRLRSLDRRARFTIAHELGHGVLHKNAVQLARSREINTKRVVPAYTSVERQAEVFASFFLVSDRMAERAESTDDLEKYLISSAAADVRWEKEQTRRSRGRISAELKALSVELRRTGSPASNPRLTALRCPVCQERKLFAVGAKYLCGGLCNRVYDAFPDGDGPTDDSSPPLL